MMKNRKIMENQSYMRDGGMGILIWHVGFSTEQFYGKIVQLGVVRL
jgi:hypothetical protein